MSLINNLNKHKQMSRLEFYKNVKTGLKDTLDTNDIHIINYVKDYVNSLDNIDSTEKAVNYILENYKKPDVVVPQVKNTTKSNASKSDIKMEDVFKNFGTDNKTDDLPRCNNQ